MVKYCDTDYAMMVCTALCLQSPTRDGSPAQSADELTEPDDEVSQPQVSAESPPPLAGVTQDLETLTTLPLELAGRSLATVASDEVQLPPIKDRRFPSSLSSATASHAPSAAESKDDTDIGDTGDVFVSLSAPLPQQTPITLEKPQFVPSEKAPEEEGKIMEEVKIFEKGAENVKLETVVEVAAPVIHVNVAKEEMAPNPVTEVSQPTHSEPESAEAETQDSEPKPTPVKTAECTLPQDSKKLSEGIAFLGTTALVKSAHSPPSTSMAEATIAVQKDTKEEGNQDAPSFIVFNPREDPTMMQGRAGLILLHIYDYYLCHSRLVIHFSASRYICSKEKKKHEAAEQEGSHWTPSRCLHGGVNQHQVSEQLYSCMHNISQGLS